MLCVVIQGPSFAAACAQIEQTRFYADLFEFRLDLFDSSCLDSLAELRALAELPVLFTLRTRAHGGASTFSSDDRCKAALHFAQLQPDFLDLEFPADITLIEKIRLNFPRIKIVLSYHDLEGIPENLDVLNDEMRKNPVFFYKIAASPKNSVETMRFLLWAKKANAQKNLIAISMGIYGQFGRILSPILGLPLMFASTEDSAMPSTGILSAQTLIERYRYHEKTPGTVICGLIGNPVSLSPSDVSHNAFFFEKGIDAVYVKIALSPEELSPFLEYAKQMPFQGLSVTMPLKEAIIPLLDEVDSLASVIGSVNTVKFKMGKLFGYNTDVSGAYKALERKKNLKGAHVVILGAGGAARAVVYAMIQAEARVTVLNRNRSRAEFLGDFFGCQVGEWENPPEKYDVLINCTPLSLPLPAEKIYPQSLVFDIVARPKETIFIQEAKKRGCESVYGIEMFIHQAVGQFKIWFPLQVGP